MNEYHISFKEPSEGHYVMRFCFSCGGEMPESKRHCFFVDMNEDEINQLRSEMGDIQNVESMFRKLGRPDTVHPWSLDDFEAIYEIEKYKAQYTYDKRWTTLSLCVTEKEDGTISYVYYPKARS